ncbi:MAG: hypothetical protein ACRDKL_01860, partial [Solirubrobacteraceae bacterium]
DVVVGWWASWHTFLPFTLAWLLRKPSLLIVGGFDTAAVLDINYGYQLGGARARLSSFTMRRARLLMTNSEYSRGEIQRNIGISAKHVRLLYHGIPDSDTAGGPLAAGSKTPSQNEGVGRGGRGPSWATAVPKADTGGIGKGTGGDPAPCPRPHPGSHHFETGSKPPVAQRPAAPPAPLLRP